MKVRSCVPLSRHPFVLHQLMLDGINVIDIFVIVI
jgi:hypothetical protein